VRVGERHASLDQGVYVRGRDGIVSEGGNGVEPLIVGKEKQNVRFLWHYVLRIGVRPGYVATPTLSIRGRPLR
jgi:hypothetical protein